jgi:DNA-binding NarL/FixJ family response regulator
VIRVVLADDQALVRGGFKALLDAQDDIEVVGEAVDGEEAVRLTSELVPDVVLMDIRMPGVDGLEATKRIVAEDRLAEVRIVILTTFDVDEYVFEALRTGAYGFLVKDTEPVELIRGVRAVAHGDALLSPSVTRRVVEDIATRGTGPGRSGRRVATLLFTDIVGSTDRARQVGDRRWRELLDRHDQLSRTNVERFGGRVVKTTGDGILAIFSEPSFAIRSADAMRAELEGVGIGIRSGVHTAEVEFREDDVGGIAVHIGRRVMEEADRGEILVSRTVRDLVAGSDIELADRSIHQLRGVEGDWQLFAVTTA